MVRNYPEVNNLAASMYVDNITSHYGQERVINPVYGNIFSFVAVSLSIISVLKYMCYLMSIMVSLLYILQIFEF